MSEASRALYEKHLSEVAAILRADEGMTARDVHDRLGKWARKTVRAYLTELLHRGLVHVETGEREVILYFARWST